MKYKIKESQYNQLIEIKKNKILVEEISKKIDRANKSLNENVLINEAVSDILTIYTKKNLIKESVKELLIKTGKVTEEQFNRIKL